MKPSQRIMSRILEIEMKQNWFERIFSDRRAIGLVAILEYLDEQHSKDGEK